MASKRRLDLDPDYEDVTEQQNKRQKVIEEDGNLSTSNNFALRKYFLAQVFQSQITYLSDQSFFFSKTHNLILWQPEKTGIFGDTSFTKVFKEKNVLMGV